MGRFTEVISKLDKQKAERDRAKRNLNQFLLETARIIKNEIEDADGAEDGCSFDMELPTLSEDNRSIKAVIRIAFPQRLLNERQAYVISISTDPNGYLVKLDGNLGSQPVRSEIDATDVFFDLLTEQVHYSG